MDRKYEQLAAGLESSEALIEAIAEVVGDDEDAILAEWQDPHDAKALIRRARELAPGDSIYWGAAGIVYMGLDDWIEQFDAEVLRILAAREDIPSPANGRADCWYTGGSSHNDYRPSAEDCDEHLNCVVVHDEQAWEHVDPADKRPEAYAADWLSMILPERED